MEYEKLSAELKIKPTGKEGEFKGIASAFSSIANGARGPTKFAPGSFSETLRETGGKIPLLWQHDQQRPIGVIHSLRETPRGLEIAGKITMNTFGRDVVELMRDGAISGLSIGFDAVDTGAPERHANGQTVRVVTRANLHETSLVTFPADRAARIEQVHSRAFGASEGGKMIETLSDVWQSGKRREFAQRVLRAVFEAHGGPPPPPPPPGAKPPAPQQGQQPDGERGDALKDAWALLTEALAAADPQFLAEASKFLASAQQPAQPPAQPPAAPPQQHADDRKREILAEIRRAEVEALTIGVDIGTVTPLSTVLSQ